MEPFLERERKVHLCSFLYALRRDLVWNYDAYHPEMHSRRYVFLYALRRDLVWNTWLSNDGSQEFTITRFYTPYGVTSFGTLP